MLELRPDPAALLRFAQAQGLNHSADEDMGYVIHAWLAAMFGPLAPKPFRFLQDRRLRQPPRLLGYVRVPGEQLADHAAAFAPPLAVAVCGLDQLSQIKPMPAHWEPGRRLGYELLACPISRQDDKEKDVFLRRLDRQPPGSPPLQREAVYSEWLQRQFGAAARVEQMRLEGFRLIRMLRRSSRQELHSTRPQARIDRPQALMRGILRIGDAAQFQMLLQRGIGRHRTFGYGMLLLRPPL
ncbi:MAG: type I-E CRISPR-associated protein Cas6/Cse3/CasE [Myxococcales bacterium]|nr:type I-E CRISPR-associated protein Cas6/Cse3/CasE [Myxococcota bacterium]MDW8284358.1 type I-E CRISPR-associated protein Cas6/Cse3/CasE [Myxococcales bacterium]